MSRWRSAIACVLSGAIGCATSEMDPPSAQVDTGPGAARQAFKQTVATHAAVALADPVTRASVIDELHQRGSVSLAELPALGAFDPGVLERGAVPEVWLHQPTGSNSADLVIAYAPGGSEASWTEIPAYTLDGTRIALDPHQAPSFPVLVIETHGRLAMRQGIADANVALQQIGLQRAAPRIAAAAAVSRWTTKLTSIRLANDQEPWISGAAEIYAVTSGVVDDNAPQLKIVELPYLDDDGTTYAPNQIIVDWTDYTYQAANIQLFEHDDDTNYQQLVTALITAVGEVGSLAGYPVVQAIGEIANRVIAAMPADWFANDDDYVDSYYTIEKAVAYTSLAGASRNATVSLRPFILTPNE